MAISLFKLIVNFGCLNVAIFFLRGVVFIYIPFVMFYEVEKEIIVIESFSFP